MNKTIIILSPWILLLLIIVSCQSNPPEHHQFFNKIIGEWQLEDKPVIEKWIEKDGNYSAKVIVTSGADKLVTEEIRIIENENGIFYEAHVADQNQGGAILFKLISLEEHKIIFENKQHDFPQRITYELTEKDKLIAIIEGILEGASKSMDFKYFRNPEINE